MSKLIKLKTTLELRSLKQDIWNYGWSWWGAWDSSKMFAISFHSVLTTEVKYYQYFPKILCFWNRNEQYQHNVSE